MSAISEILDRFREAYPEPEHDWRFRSGRMAEEIDALQAEVARLREALKHIREASTVLYDEGKERVLFQARVQSITYQALEHSLVPSVPKVGE